MPWAFASARKSSFNRFFEIGGAIRVREVNGRLRYRKQIIGPMIRFAGKQRYLLLAPLLLRNVAGDFRRADDRSCLVGHRRNGQRNINQASVLATPLGFEMIDRLAAADTIENAYFLVPALGRNDDRNRLADNLVGGIAEEALCRFVPRRDDTVEVFADDGVIAGFDNGRKATLDALRALVLADIDQYIHGADKRAGWIVKWRRKCHVGYARTVWPLRDGLLAATRFPFLEGKRHRILIVRKRCTVGAEELPGAAPSIDIQPRPAAPKLRRGIVEIGNSTLGVGDVNGGGKYVE